MGRREISLLLVIAALGIVLAAVAPGYFARENLSDLFLGSMPVLIVAIGTTLVILTGNIDISVGSVFAICGVVAGVAAKCKIVFSAFEMPDKDAIRAAESAYAAAGLAVARAPPGRRKPAATQPQG